MNRTRLAPFACLCVLVASVCGIAAAAEDVYEALDVPRARVLNITRTLGRVLPGDQKQVICVVTYFTGKRARDEAVNVRLGVFRESAGRLTEVFVADYGESYGLVGDGQLELIDIDYDGVQEIIASFDLFTDPLIEQRQANVMLYSPDGGFQIGWSGPIEYDATKAARTVAAERRDHFTREFDYAETLRTRGKTLFMNKRVIAVAGQRLAEPRVVQETFPLRSRTP